MGSDTSKRVAETVWNWRAAQATPEQAAARAVEHAAELRKRGVIQAGIGLTIAAVFYFWVGAYYPKWKVVGIIGASIASFIGLSALVSPTGLFARIERGIFVVAHWVGVILTHLLMPPIYWFFFVPFRFLFRRGKRDKMLRTFPDPSETTFWVDRSGEEQKPEHYLRQF